MDSLKKKRINFELLFQNTALCQFSISNYNVLKEYLKI